MFWKGDKVSVLVKGMTMPESCVECRMTTDAWFCSAMPKEFGGYADDYGEKRPDWCPLVELPEKHGRLIDAEALIDTLEQAIAIMETMLKQLDLEDDNGCLMELKAYRDIRDGIKEIDAVIEAEGEG